MHKMMREFMGVRGNRFKNCGSYDISGFFFFSSRRRHTRFDCDWSSDVCSSDLGAGSASRRPLGYAIVGGIFFSTVLTLFVVPVGYVLLDRLTAREPSHARVARPVEAD